MRLHAAAPTLLLFLAAATVAAEGAPPAASEEPPPAACLDCHTESSDMPVYAIYRTPHGSLGTGSQVCVTCHGPSVEHQRAPTDVAPTVSFGPHWDGEAGAQTGVCLGCHEGSAATYWVGSVHDDEGLNCANCHVAHARFDPVRERASQAETCFECHKGVQTSVRLQSRHPILEGRTACVDCHDPHGSATVAELVEPTLNDTCFDCHADKRGPYLFEHPPAAEDCSLCHTPHGSVNPALLTARGPFLCQQCHSAAFHPSQLYDADSLPGGRAGQNLLGSNCLNCHPAVHGSNHPSGARLTR